MSIDIKLKQVKELIEMFGEDEETEITLCSGVRDKTKGIFAYFTEYPSEGSEFLEATP